MNFKETTTGCRYGLLYATKVQSDQKPQDGDRGKAGCRWTTAGVGIAQMKRYMFCSFTVSDLYMGRRKKRQDMCDLT